MKLAVGISFKFLFVATFWILSGLCARYGWKIDQEMNNTNSSPWSIFKNDYHDFDYYLNNLEIKSKTEKKVPDSVFFLLDEERDRLLGAVNIRHYLNESLLKEGGHIGDGIRPSERKKGYATEMVRLALIECKNWELKEYS